MSGVQRVSYEILKNLPAEEYEKHILFSSEIDAGDKEYCISMFKEIGVNVILNENIVREISLSKDIKAFKEIHSLCKQHQFDIVHTHSTKPGIVGRIAARLAGVPKVIHTVHGTAYHKYVKFSRRIYYYSIEFFASFFSHKIVLVNNYYRKYYSFFKKKVTVIHNGIDFSQLPKKEYNKITPPEKNIELLFVGRLDIPKDPLTLLKAINYLKTNLHKNNFVLKMVGDGEYYNDCKKYIEDNNLISSVKLLGWRTDVSTFYKDCDIFCTSSIYDAFGIMFLEAGYYRIPVVSTLVEGIPEVVKNGETGILIPEKDEVSLAKAICVLMEDAELRKHMGDNAHDWVTKEFTLNKFINKYLQIYS